MKDILPARIPRQIGPAMFEHTHSIMGGTKFYAGGMPWLCKVQTNMATSSSHSFEIIKNTKGKANGWEHFGFVKENDDNIVDKTRVACKICRLVLKYSGNSIPQI